MKIPHDGWVLVADGRKMLLLRNEGDEKYPNLELKDKNEHLNPKDGDQKSDAAGAASSTQSGPGAPPIAQGGSMHAMGQGAQFAPSRGSLGEADYHQLEEDRFAAEIAEMLNSEALSGSFDSLAVVAPPRALGELRKHYHQEVSARLIGEVAKDLTGHPIVEIERILIDA